MASCTSDAIRAMMECGDENYLKAECKNVNALSPFELTTYILLNARYRAENVLIDRCLLTTPPKLYQEIESEFMNRFKDVKVVRFIQRDKFIELNSPNIKSI